MVPPVLFSSLAFLQLLLGYALACCGVLLHMAQEGGYLSALCFSSGNVCCDENHLMLTVCALSLFGGGCAFFFFVRMTQRIDLYLEID